MAILGRIMPAGIWIPKVMDARVVPRMDARRRRATFVAAGSLLQRVKELWVGSFWLHSLNKEATSSVDCTLNKLVQVLGSRRDWESVQEGIRKAREG